MDITFFFKKQIYCFLKNGIKQKEPKKFYIQCSYESAMQYKKIQLYSFYNDKAEFFYVGKHVFYWDGKANFFKIFCENSLNTLA